MSMNTVKWGVLGCAKINNRVVPAINACERAELVAIASRSEEKVAEQAEQFGAAKRYVGYEELLADPEVDAVYNPLPNALHAEWTIRAAEAGKHILCEKPLAVNAAEGAKMVDAAKTSGVLLMEAFMYRHHPQHRVMREAIAAGKIGEPRLVRASFSYHLPPCENVRWSKPLEGGALMDVGCYCVNASRFVFAAEPERAHAVARFHTEPGREVDWLLTGILEFPGDRLAQIDCSMLTMGRNCYEVIGTEGRILVPASFVPGSADTTVVVTSGGKAEETVIDGIDQYQLEVDHFCECIQEGGGLRAPAEDGVANMRAIDMLFAAARGAG